MSLSEDSGARTVAPWLADHGLLDCPRYGVSLDNPMNTPPEKCRYDACVELPRGLDLPDAAETTIRGRPLRRHALQGHGRRDRRGLGRVRCCDACRLRNRPDAQRHPFEHYPRGASFDVKTGMFSCELCLPLGS